MRSRRTRKTGSSFDEIGLLCRVVGPLPEPSGGRKTSIDAGAEGADGMNTGSTGGGNTMETMGLTERRTLLTTMCGVISVCIN